MKFHKTISIITIFISILIIFFPCFNGNLKGSKENYNENFLDLNTSFKNNGKINECFEEGPEDEIIGMKIVLSASLAPLDYDSDKDMDFICGTANDVFIVTKTNEGYVPSFMYELPDSSDGYTDNLFHGDLTSADYNNDGKEDFIVGGVQGVIRLFVNMNGTPNVSSFKMYQLAEFGQTAYGLTSADFDNDGFIDFAVSWATAPFEYSTISIFYNKGDLSFEQEDVYTFDSYIHDLESGDFDNDGDVDLVFTYNKVKYYWGYDFNVIGVVKILYNDGIQQFMDEDIIIERGCGNLIGGPFFVWGWLRLMEKLGIYRANPDVTVEDYDMDGDYDLLLGDNSGKVEFFINNGNTYDSVGVIHDFGSYSWGLASADFDGDGDIDFIVAASKEPDYSGNIFLKKNKIM